MKKIISIITTIIITLSFISCSNSNNSTKATNTKETKVEEKKYENKELKEYVTTLDDNIKKLEKIYEDVAKFKTSKEKVSNYKDILYQFSLIADEMVKFKKKSTISNDITKIHDDTISQYVNSLNSATLYISMTSQDNPELFTDEVIGKKIREAEKKLENTKEVYYKSKDRMLKEEIYKK